MRCTNPRCKNGLVTVLWVARDPHCVTAQTQIPCLSCGGAGLEYCCEGAALPYVGYEVADESPDPIKRE